MTACISTSPIPIPREGQAAVSVRGLCKDYRSGGGRVRACEGIDFSASAASLTVLLGPNGAGKSTLLKCIAGILLPSFGDVCVLGEREDGRIRAAVGYVGEQPCLDDGLTVAESLFCELGMRAELFAGGKEPADFFWGRLREVVALSGLGGVLDTKCGSLSKGYAQRVALAQALAWDPPLLILDEFSGGLDPAQAVAVRTALKKRSAGRAVIVSTHNIGEAGALGGRIVIMRGGRVVASGSEEEILEETGEKTLEAAFLRLTA